mgnify:CR=1 FL=1
MCQSVMEVNAKEIAPYVEVYIRPHEREKFSPIFMLTIKGFLSFYDLLKCHEQLA